MFLFIAITTMCAGFVYAQSSSCQTPGGRSGECISILKCKPLKALFDKPNKTDQDVTQLTKSRCGSIESENKVCCPIEIKSEPVDGGSATCTTPDGKLGKCVSVYSCRHIGNMFTPPVSKENMAFVRNSRCNGPDKYSVCCGPPPIEGCPPNMTAFPPDPSSKCCGNWVGEIDKIIGGIRPAIDQYPWSVLIEYNTKDGRSVLYCGGVLISGKYVLTAAHCIAGSILKIATPKTVRLGEYDIANEGFYCVEAPGSGLDCTDGVTRIAIENTIPHPNYDKDRSKRNDIGLIRLEKIAPLTDFIRPICLPAKDLTQPENTPSDFSIYAVGWGATELKLLSNLKMHINLPFVSQEKCQPFYNSSNNALWKGQLCAGGKESKDTCKGDSGGPLVFENQERLFEVIGIASYGSVPCGQNEPGVYSNVHVYFDWIKSVIVA